MTKWEYDFVKREGVNDAVVQIGGVATGFIGDDTEFVRQLNILGDQGWEVVTCSGLGDSQLWTLKRPLSSE